MATLLTHARIVDGSGAPAFDGDVLVRDGRIVAVGPDLASSDAARDAEVVDLAGLTLTPGFIDVHTHFDAQILWDPTFSPSSWHGVTTVLMGNCGFGIAPTRPEHREVALHTLKAVEGMSYEALEAGIDWDFETFPEYLDSIDRRPKSLNVVPLIPHSSLRLYVMGLDSTQREATPEEIAEMRAIVAEAMAAGAGGLATSKLPNHVGGDGAPVPSRLASFEEVAELVTAVGEAGRGVIEIASGPGLMAAETAELARRSNRPITFPLIDGVDYAAVAEGRMSLNTGGEAGSAKRLVAQLEAADLRIAPQVTCRPLSSQTSLAKPFPFAPLPSFAEVFQVELEDRLAVYADPEWRERARPEVAGAWGHMWARASIQESPTKPEWFGRTLEELGAELGQEPFDVMIDLAVADELATRFGLRLANDNEDTLTEFFADDRMLVSISDAGAHSDMICDACFATYFLGHWSRDLGRVPLERAVSILTGRAAEFLGFTDRGLIRPGYAADLVAFDADTIGTHPPRRVWDFPAGADRLVMDSIGVEHVWVNGEAIRRDGEPVDGAYPGLILRD
jgi:N-acyl-D-aspartate/D-glutamate deacylase